MKNTDREARRRPLVAGLLSFLLPGLGQLYNGELKKAVVLYLCVYALCLVFAGLACRTFFGLVAGIAVTIVFEIAVIADAVVRARRLGTIRLKRFNRWYVYVAAYCVLGLIVAHLAESRVKAGDLGFKAFRMAASSMSPSLARGDHIMAALGNFEAQDLRRGDVIVFEYPEDRSKDFIKRVIAVAGRQIEIKDKKIFVNGKPIREPWALYSSPTIIPGSSSPRDHLPSLRIPDSTVFVMGDNRDASFDSRFFGPVPTKLVRGKALYIYWSDDLGRIGTSLDSEP